MINENEYLQEKVETNLEEKNTKETIDPKIQNLLAKYETSLNGRIGVCNIIKHEIPLIENSAKI